MTCPIVFFDIAGLDDDVLREFYSEVFGWEADDSGNLEIPVMNPLEGAIRRDPTEKRIYIGVPDVAACLRDIELAGGSIDAARFVVPGVVILGLFQDPAGNPMGLVEMDGDKPRVP